MKNIIRIYNLTVKFSKLTINIEIYEEFVEFLSKLVWRETLFVEMVRRPNYIYSASVIETCRRNFWIEHVTTIKNVYYNKKKSLQ